MVRHKKGTAFIREKTGSATTINLEKKLKPDFAGGDANGIPADNQKNKEHKIPKPVNKS